jgi:hypothetical protein
VPVFSSAIQPTKIALFSSAADEKEPIFIEFISSAYFHPEADKNSYFRWHWAYFRRLLADENVMFSCSEPSPSLYFKISLSAFG